MISPGVCILRNRSLMTGEPNDEGKAQQDLNDKLWQSLKIYVKDHQQYIHDEISALEASSPLGQAVEIPLLWRGCGTSQVAELFEMIICTTFSARLTILFWIMCFHSYFDIALWILGGASTASPTLSWAELHARASVHVLPCKS